MTDLLTPQEITTVEVPASARFSKPVVLTAVRMLAESMEPKPAIPLPVLINKIVAEVEPWSPVPSRDGRMGTRLKNYLWKEFRAQVNDTLFSHVAGFMADDMPNGELHYDITNKFNWYKGEFGDHGSCFWGKGGLLGSMSKAGVRALRWYTRDNKSSDYRGVARAWVAPFGDGAVLFNAYGVGLKQLTSRLNVIAPDLHVKLVKLTNKGSVTQPLQINLGRGLFVGKESISLNAIDLNLRIGGDYIDCPNCGEEFYRHGGYHCRNGDIICHTCAENPEEYLFSVGDGYYYRSDQLVEIKYVMRGEDGKYTRTIAHNFPGEMNKITTCEHCEHHMDIYSYIYVSHKRKQERWCMVCLLEANAQDNKCRYCGSYKIGGEKCYCRTH